MERFWSKVDRRGPSECWEWTAHRVRFGYGQFRFDGRNTHAHRVAWMLTRGPIPDGLWVLHRCDNPPCVNPAHLWLGTLQDNNADCTRKGRRPKGDANGSRLHPERLVRGDAHPARRTPEKWHRGAFHPRAKLTAQQVSEIRQRRAQGEKLKCLAADYGVTVSQVSSIATGRTWKGS